MRTIADLPFIDYADPAYAAAPYEWLAEQALNHRIARSDRGVELLDYNLCRAFVLDRTMGTDHGNLVENMGIPESRALTFKRRMLLTQNRGEVRQRLRGALTGLIGPKQAGDLREGIAGVVSNLLDALPDGVVDLKHAFADLVPAGVYCHWVDAPLSQARFVSEMSETVLAIFRRDPSLTPRIVAAYDELFAYAADRIAARKQAMGDDFLSQLIRVQQVGALSESELEDFAVMLIEASTDNTAASIAIIIDRLTAQPGVWAAIANDPTLAIPAVREAMRLWPRSISTSRTALEDTAIEDVAIPKGASIFASFGAAHRQPEIFENPHKFDLTRAERPPHMNFGGGAFACLGQFVATIEVEEAIAQLAACYPNLKVLNADRDYTPMFHRLKQLDVSLK